jgi:hypothetical protein
VDGQKTVDEYIGVRRLAHRCHEAPARGGQEGAPHSAVAIKWAQPVWEWNGPMIWMKAYPKHVDIGFWRGTRWTIPEVLTGDGERMRHIRDHLGRRHPGGCAGRSRQAGGEAEHREGNPTLGR